MNTRLNPYVFFVGSPRSGTTMLKRMASAHSQLAVTRETHWIPKYYERRRGITDEGLVLPELVDQLFEYHRFSQMKLSRDRLLRICNRNPGLSYADLVTQIFDHYGKRKKKPLVGDKTPFYVRKIPTLATLWPQVRIVHLIRDGRDVALSMRNWRMAHKAAGRFATWKADPVVTGALWWKAMVAVGRQDGAKLGIERYWELHYEALVKHPQHVCAELTGFLGLPYEDAMVNYHQGKTCEGDGLSANAAWKPPTKGLRDWREQMPPEDIERFEAVAGDLLDALGYERAFPTVAHGVRQQTDLLKEQFTLEANTRNWRLPENW